MGALGFGGELAVGRGRVRLPPVFDFTGGVLPAGATLSRASPATCWTAGGILATMPADAARFDHDPATHALRGLLIEPAATNLLRWSGQLDQWDTQSQCAVVADAGPAADGSGGFDRLVPATGTEVTARLADTITPKVAGTTYTLSVFVRYETVRWLMLNAAANRDTRLAWFDLQDGTIGVVGTGASSAAITRIDPTTIRVALTFVGTSSAYCGLGPVKGDGQLSADFVAGDTVGAWGAMLEAGTAASSLIHTDGAAATRAADALVLHWGGRGVADGPASVRYTFDDASTQDVATQVTLGRATVPTDLNRCRLRRAAII